MGIKIVHYINQFYGGIGGEDKADYAPEKIAGVKGPGMGLQAAFGDKATITATIICGDSYFNENIEEATAKILDLIREESPDVFIAGPAFNAGRYGVACGAMCKAVGESLNIPVVTGMYIENPGMDMYKKDAYMVSTANSAAGMKDALEKVAGLAVKLGSGASMGTPEEEGYMPRGIRQNIFCDDRGAKRAVDMLVQKLKGEAFTTEYPMPIFDRVEPSAPVADVRKAKIAIVSSGGPVPKGNPDRIEASSASKYGKYSIEGIDDLTPENGETAHGGYDPVYANQDLDRVIPVDVLREMEQSGEIGELFNYYYTTVGNGTAVANAKKFAEAIALDLKANAVDAVILTST